MPAALAVSPVLAQWKYMHGASILTAKIMKCACPRAHLLSGVLRHVRPMHAL